MNGLPAAILEGGGKAVVSVEPECVDIYSQFLVNESKLSRSCTRQPWLSPWLSCFVGKTGYEPHRLSISYKSKYPFISKKGMKHAQIKYLSKETNLC